ncbi:SGNH/GDSL hydrolase family protein [Saccharibacillus sp. CPCC 101409]|uniref:SGNH/GDSL hydrolase family protein n=1 Tax=Saccharibacillus sp. CPCC 101409 TaxID=3058041 RepID=UPI002671C77C|nr:SGNH/GDSL hydrolase family protein [Saccharibacillus sp. CPCC 101409]MDO3412553.1 SGNH/GDSL hydrolase family protein [Saccharibacillus sp. CPCC 101409]
MLEKEDTGSGKAAEPHGGAAAAGGPVSAVTVKDGVAFHGAAELEAAPNGGVYIRRIPRSVRERLGARGRFIAAEATGCELRFVTSSQTVDATLSLPVHGGTVAVYKGGLFHSEHRLEAGEVRTLRLSEPQRLESADRGRLRASGFAPEVWRIRFGRSEAVYHGLDAFGAAVRPPEPGEVPKAALLAYGSSITHGGEMSRSAYIDRTARLLGCDLHNLGMSGSCLCEPELIDWIAARRDWDILFLEPGVNMRDGMDGDQFRSRVRYALERISSAHPGSPIFLTTIYPNFSTLTSASPRAGQQDRRFNQILREEAQRLEYPPLRLLEGDTILTEADGLSCDLIHPGDEGHVRMGENLARRMREDLGEDLGAGCIR